MEISERIKELRKGMRLNQTAFGALGGVSNTTQRNYESGQHKPNFDYLEALADAGVDVVYLLTGRRDPQLLTDDQRRLVRLFDSLSSQGQRTLVLGLEAERAGSVNRGEDRRARVPKGEKPKHFKPIGGDRDKR